MRWTDLPEFENCPDGWEVIPLSQIAEFVAGQSPDSALYNALGEGLPFLQGNAEFGATNPQPTTYCTAPTKICETGDTLISVRAPVGALNRADQSYGLGRGVGALHPKGISSEYLYQAMTRWYLPLRRAAQGSTFDAVTARHFRQLRCCLPTDSNEQEAIAKRLSLADEAIAAAEAKITAARRLKTALMQQLFTRGIPGRHSRFRQTKIGEIPASWEVVPMSSVIDGTIRNGFSASESQNSTQWRVLSLDALGFDEFVPTGHKPIFWDDEIEAELAQFILKPNDLLVSRSNTPDRVGLAGLYEGSPENCIYPDLMMRFRVFENEVKPKYAEYFLRTTHARRWFQSRASGTSGSMVKIKRRDLRQLRFIKPELDEQGEICTLLEASQSTIQAIRNEISLLHRLKRSLLQNLLTGRVRVRMEGGAAAEQMPLFSSRSDGGD